MILIKILLVDYDLNMNNNIYKASNNTWNRDFQKIAISRAKNPFSIDISCSRGPYALSFPLLTILLHISLSN